MSRTLALRPLDTLLFRDNRPFNQDDEGLGEARSLFPPMPFVLAAALRASMARRLGWDGTPPGWAAHAGLLGRDALDPGLLRFGPPMVLRGGAVRFPCPAALLARPPRPHDGRAYEDGHKVGELRLARPGPDAAPSDLGLDADQMLPAIVGPDRAAFEQNGHLWLGEIDMKTLLRGEQVGPHDVVESAALFGHQPRIGLERDLGKHIAMTGMLYQAFHVRPRAEVALAITYGWADDRSDRLPEPEPGFALGGHGRAVSVEQAEAIPAPWGLTPEVETFHEQDGWLHYMVVLLSPTHLGGAAGRDRLPGLPGEIVSACFDRPLVFGGWDTARRDRLPSLRYYRAGSTFFLRVALDATTTRESCHAALIAAQQRGIGDAAQLGCGAFLVGTWRPLEQ